MDLAFITQAEAKQHVADVPLMRGINYSDVLHDGDMADSRNISARRYPYITTRRAREKQAFTDAIALTGWDKLAVVEKRTVDSAVKHVLVYDSRDYELPLAADNINRQFAVVNTKLVIWPDKVYLDLKEATPSLHSLGAALDGITGAVFSKSSGEGTSDELADKIVFTLAEGVKLTNYFKVGDVISISGCATLTENNKDILIEAISDEEKSITTSKDSLKAGTEPESGSTVSIKLERKIPDMDFICERENRLWGCSSDTQTIFASASGDPTNFYVFSGIATDSFQVAVGTPGDFTGCCKLSSSVLFFKENTLHKIIGSYPAEYYMYEYTVEGLRQGCHKSMKVINETLFYMGLNGVYAYDGNTPSLISQNFGERQFTAASAGSDGDSYYISCKDKDNRWHLLVYETTRRIWIREDDLRVIDFARIGTDLYFLTADHEVFKAATNTDDAQMEWNVDFTPFYETLAGRKRYSKILLRAEIPQGSFVSVFVRYDGGVWRQAATVPGSKSDIRHIRIPIVRCDRFEIRICGKGPSAILGMQRAFAVGSEV